MVLKKRDFIYLKLDMLKDKVISRDTLLKVIKLTDSKTPLKDLENLRKAKKIIYIILNYYYVLSEDERRNKILKYTTEEIVVSVLNKLKIKWHYTLYTALNRNNIVWQAYRIINILNDSISKKIIINKTQFHFIKTQKKYIFDFKIVKTKNRISTFYPSNEKLLIDFVYFKKKVPIELTKVIKKSNITKCMKSYPIIIQNKVKNELK